MVKRILNANNISQYFGLVALVFLISVNSYAQKLVGSELPEHGKKLELVQYSPDGEYLAGVISSEVKVWVAGTPTIKANLNTPHKEIYDFVFTPDSKFLITVGKDAKGSAPVRVWDLETKQAVRSLNGHLGEINAVAISNDGKYIATASDDRMVKLWNFETGKEVNTFFTHKEAVYDVAFSSDGKYLASAGDDKNVIVRTLPIGQEIENGRFRTSDSPTKLSFSVNNHVLNFADAKGNLSKVNLDAEKPFAELMMGGNHKDPITGLVYSSDGKYLASGDEGGRFVVWNMEKNIVQNDGDVNGKLYSLAFNPNGKTLATTGKENIWDVSSLNIAPRLIYKNSGDSNGPQIYLKSPSMSGDTKTLFSSTVSIIGSIFDESGIYSLTVNNKSVDFTSDGSFSMSMPLRLGSNKVRIQAKDVNNNISVKEFTVIRESQSDEEFLFNVAEATNHLLIIGANNYSEWPKLSNPVSDAKAVQKVLNEKYGFEQENIITLFDNDVTKQGILDAFTELFQRVKPTDNVMIYYSGHGAYDDIYNEGFWVPINAGKNATADYFSNSELLKRVKTINSKHTFLVVDACYSGSLFTDATRGGGGYIEKVGKIKSRWGLAAGLLQEVSDGGKGTMSPFCKSFTEFLEKNTEKEFIVSDLVQFVKKNIDAAQTPYGSPLKDVGDEGGEFVFRLAEE